MVLSKSIIPKTRADLIRSIQRASFRSFEDLEGALLDRLRRKPQGSNLLKQGKWAALQTIKAQSLQPNGQF